MSELRSSCILVSCKLAPLQHFLDVVALSKLLTSKFYSRAPILEEHECLYPIKDVLISLAHAPSAYTCTAMRIALQHILPASAKMFGSNTRCRRKMRRVYHSLKLTRCVYSSRRGTDVTDNYTRQLSFRSSCAIASLSC